MAPQERFELPTPSFGGDENSRGQVLQFVQVALGQIALKVDGAVVRNAYPSRAGMSSGTGDSGSTGMVRSRLSVHEAETGHGEPPDPNVRILERKKANYASRGGMLRLRWRNGVIESEPPESPGTTVFGKLDAAGLFLSLVPEFDGQGRPVSANSRSGNYAPRVFGKLPARRRCECREADLCGQWKRSSPKAGSKMPPADASAMSAGGS